MVGAAVSSSILILLNLAIRALFRGKVSNVLIYSLWLLVAIRLLMPLPGYLLNTLGIQTPSVRSRLSVMNYLPFIQEENQNKADAGSQETDMKSVAGLQKEGDSLTAAGSKEGKSDAAASTDKAGSAGSAASSRKDGHNSSASFTQGADQGVLISSAQRAGSAASSQQDGPDFWASLTRGGDALTSVAGHSGVLRYILLTLWFIGFAGVLLRQYVYHRKMQLRLAENRLLMNVLGEKFYVTDIITTPLLAKGAGISTDIYIPRAILGDETLLHHALLHENTHRKHRDILWGAIRILCLAIYWFDPLVWLAAFVSKQDCEYACDASVVKSMDHEEKIMYGESLLSLISVGNRNSLLCNVTSMSGSKSEIKARLLLLKNSGKSSLAAIAGLVALVILASVIVFTAASNSSKKQVATGAKDTEMTAATAGDKTSGGIEAKDAETTPSTADGAKKAALPEKEEVDFTEAYPYTKKEQAAYGQLIRDMKSVPLQAATCDQKDAFGTDGFEINYVNDNYMILSNWAGVYVYDFKQEHIISSLDRRYLHLTHTQGDSYCEIKVFEGGSFVFLHALDTDDLLIYAWKTDELKKTTYRQSDMMRLPFYHPDEKENEADEILTGAQVCKSETSAKKLYLQAHVGRYDKVRYQFGKHGEMKYVFG